MSQTKTKKDSRTIRECTAKWEYNGESGTVESAEVRVQYYSPTIAQLKADRLAEERRIEEDPTTVIWLSELLSKSIYALHDIPNEASVKQPSVEWLDEQDLKNLTAVRSAIDEDLKAGK